MGYTQWASEYLRKRFEGCECLGKVRLRATHQTQLTVFVFKLTHDVAARKDGRPYGAWYSDGAVMLWPHKWLNKEDLIKPTDEELEMLEIAREKCILRERQKKDVYAKEHGRLRFSADGKYLGVSKRVRKTKHTRVRKRKHLREHRNSKRVYRNK